MDTIRISNSRPFEPVAKLLRILLQTRYSEKQKNRLDKYATTPQKKNSYMRIKGGH